MTSRATRNLRAALVASLAMLGGQRLAHAADDGPAPPAASTTKSETTDPRDELVKRMLATDDRDDDLAWLYSHADEYSRSSLTDEPLPAEGIPERGGGSRRTWDPHFRKFGPWNYVLTAGGFAVNLGSFLIPPKDPAWRSQNSLDEWGRSHLGAPSWEAGQWARDGSDVFVSLTLAYPLLVDSLIVMYWYRRSPEVAAQIALISLEAEAVAALLQGPTAALTSRERPYGRDCGKSIPSNLEACAGHDRYRSYFSGHTTLSFSAAAVSCSHHARHDVFGDPVADGIACGAALTSAAAVGTMRIVGQKHYITDVLTGAAVGTLSGLGVPWLLHYGPLARLRTTNESALMSFSVIPLPGGIAAGGTF
ncbi:MAG TPA: phosphatase PAP2 family protein [Polyangiaceae bacterium]|nr:phosphatase PAP2 family protein [Polyangiaceae bacterium]